MIGVLPGITYLCNHGLFFCILERFIYSSFAALLDILFCKQFFKIEISKSRIAIFIILNTILKFITFVIIPVPYYMFFHIVFSTLIFRYGLNQTIEKSVLAEATNALIIVSLEAVFSKLCCVLYPDINTYAEGLMSCEYNISLKICMIISRFLILGFFIFKDIHISLQDQLQKSNKINIIVTSVCGMLIAVFYSIQLLYFVKEFPYTTFLLNIGSLIFCFYIGIKNIVRINELETQDLKIHSLEIYNKTLGIMYDSIRGFKHDFGNFVIALDGYVKAEDITGIKQMSNAVLTECKQINDMGGILDPQIVGNPALYSIITNKYYLAKEQGVNMTIEVMTNLEQYNKHSYEICRILGILLDNAIEAAKETKEKIMNVRILEDAKHNRKLIIIENSYNNKEINMNKIFDKGYTTKNTGRGLGLWNIKSILMHNEDLNLFTTKEDLFKQQLEIYTKTK